MLKYLIFFFCSIALIHPFTQLAASYENALLWSIDAVSSPSNFLEYPDPISYNYEELAQPLYAASPPPPSQNVEVLPSPEEEPPTKKKRSKKSSVKKKKMIVEPEKISPPMTRSKSAKLKNVTFQLPSRPQSPTLLELTKSLPQPYQEPAPLEKPAHPKRAVLSEDDGVKIEKRGRITYLNVYNTVFWKVVPGFTSNEIDLEAWRRETQAPKHQHIPSPPLKRKAPQEFRAFDENNNNNVSPQVSSPLSHGPLKSFHKNKPTSSRERTYRSLYKNLLITKMATLDLRTGSSLSVFPDMSTNTLAKPIAIPTGAATYPYLSPQEFLAMIEQMTFGTLKIYIGDILCACEAYLLETENPAEKELLEELSDVIYEYFVHLATTDARKLQQCIRNYIWVHRPDLISEDIMPL